MRVRPASIRHVLSRQESALPIKLLTLKKNILNTASRIRIDTHRLEDDKSTVNL